jgi:hypothetical protein
MEVDIMIPVNLEEVLLKLVGELPASEFGKACSKAGLTKAEIDFIIDMLFDKIADKEGE